MVFTILKNISQWEGLSHILRKNKIHVPNNQPNIFGRAYIVSESDNARVKKHVRSRVECAFFKLVGKKNTQMTSHWISWEIHMKCGVVERWPWSTTLPNKPGSIAPYANESIAMLVTAHLCHRGMTYYSNLMYDDGNTNIGTLIPLCGGEMCHTFSMGNMG